VTQSHMDRLTSFDTSFLANERDNGHMALGAVMVCEGSAPSLEDFNAHILSRLHLLPRLRQRVVFPPMQLGRPFWVDFPDFDISQHVRRVTLPEPGSDAQFHDLVGRCLSPPLDRSKPLWELWLVQGLERDRFALLTKTHHAMVDGISGVDIGTVLFDLEPVPEPAAVEDTWVPRRPPSTAELVGRGLGDAIGLPIKVAEKAVDAIRHPESAARKAVEALEALSEVVSQFADPAPDVPLNQEIGPHRRYVWARSELATFKRIKDTFGGTVNDVVLAVVTGSIRNWLHSRGVRTEGLELRALVPVSIRAEDEHGNLGNRITLMRGPLPVYIEDPVRRLHTISEEMAGLKESKQALGAEMISRFNDFAPPTLLAQASRLNFSTRLFNLLVTNVPGPQIPLYVLGRELEEVFPVAFLPQNHAVAIAIMSYHGKVGFGLLADYDSMEDVEILGTGINEALDELLAAAGDSAAAA